MKELARTITIWICCLILLGGAGVGFYWVVGGHVHEMRTFQPVEAEVIGGGVGDGPGRGLNYRPSIEYKYTFNGKTYRSNKYKTQSWASDSKSSPQHIVDRYPVGSKHTAWVDPAHPENAVLVRELNLLSFGLLVVFSLIPIGMLVFYYRDRARRRAAVVPAPAPERKLAG